MDITGSYHGEKWLFLFLQINYSNDSNVMKTLDILPQESLERTQNFLHSFHSF